MTTSLIVFAIISILIVVAGTILGIYTSKDHKHNSLVVVQQSTEDWYYRQR